MDRVRVHVMSGDGEEDLGLGWWVDNVTVYAVITADGLESLKDAEDFPLHQFPEGVEVERIEDNPKIILDSGKTVYGCQVWWEPVEDIQEPSLN